MPFVGHRRPRLRNFYLLCALASPLMRMLACNWPSTDFTLSIVSFKSPEFKNGIIHQWERDRLGTVSLRENLLEVQRKGVLNRLP
jgi:hypothetical protein